MGLGSPLFFISSCMCIRSVDDGLRMYQRPMMQPRRQLNDNPWFLLYSIAEGSMVILHEFDAEDDDTKDQKHDRLLQRIALMLVLAAFSFFLISTAFMALPLLTGRTFYNFIMLRFGFIYNDPCAFWTECYLLRAIYIITCFVFDHIWTRRTHLLLNYVLIWTRNALLFSVWTMLTPLRRLATKAWQGKLERIRNVGINRLPSMWLLREVIGSIINTLLTTLCVTYLLVQVLFPLLGLSQSINLAVGRFTWPALLALVTVWFMFNLTRDLIIHLHRLVFNERYLVGERVDNLTEDP